MAGESDEVVRSLTELLALAKVAMPAYLFAIDPRVQRACQVIATRLQVSGNRTPSILATRLAEMLDLEPPPTLQELDRTPGAEPPWDISAGLDAFMASDLAPGTRTEAVTLILRDWLTGHGYVDLPPDEESERH